MPNELVWSAQQERALREVAKWLRARDKQVYRLWGYAGTGKTTIARHIAENVSGGPVLFAAYTGKAAHVMRRKGCTGASTIHRLIYKVEDVFICPNHPADTHSRPIALCRVCKTPVVLRSSPNFILNPNSPLATARLLIVDEGSMINERLGQDLLSFDVPILVLADPAQLPPPEGCGFFTHDADGRVVQPDIMLTDIHRQARDNPIIKMSMIVREGGRLEIGRYGESRVVAACDLEDEPNDQILVGRNPTRREANSVTRKALGLTDPLPMVGDWLVCLRNSHAIGLLNGSMWKVEGVSQDRNVIRMRIRPEEGGASIDVATHAAFFTGGAKADDRRYRDYHAFDYGYVLTVHKAKGSQWDRVLLMDQSAQVSGFCDPVKWLYTGLSRAAERVTVMV
jgi:exodeoxyribonuclease-5